MNQNKYHYDGHKNINYNTSLLAVKNKKWNNDNQMNKRHEIDDNFDSNMIADKYLKNNYNAQKQQSLKMCKKTLNGEFQNLSIQRNFDNDNVVIQDIKNTNSICLSKLMDLHQTIGNNSMKFKENYVDQSIKYNNVFVNQEGQLVPCSIENKQMIYNSDWQQQAPLSSGDVMSNGFNHNTLHVVNKIGNYCHQLPSNYPILYNYINNGVGGRLIEPTVRFEQSSGPRPILSRLGNNYF